MQNDNIKFKIIFLSLWVLFLTGCINNIDLRKQTKESKFQEQKNIALNQMRPIRKKILDIRYPKG